MTVYSGYDFLEVYSRDLIMSEVSPFDKEIRGLLVDCAGRQRDKSSEAAAQALSI